MGHDRNTPSLKFYTKTNKFKCFGCGIYGDNIELVKVSFSQDFGFAMDWFRRYFNIQTNSYKPARIISKRVIISPKKVEI